MHPNPNFRQTDHAQSLAFARERGFGVLCANGATFPMLSHVPALISTDGTYADLHLVRSNPIARALKPADTPPLNVTLAINGPDSYISPDWYGVPDQVPTWNYVAVHIIGTLAPLNDDTLPGILDELSHHFEHRLAPKPIWTRDKMTEGTYDKMARMIQPFRLTVTDVQSTWKLNQNKPDAPRHSAANHVAAYGIGTEIGSLSALMHAVPDTTPDTAPDKDT